MIIDTHCHYNLAPFNDLTGELSASKAWSLAQEKKVAGSIVVGTTVVDSQLAITLAEKQPVWQATIGIHPGNYQLEAEVTNEELQQLTADIHHSVHQLETLSTHPSVVAIGEIGLDYFRLAKSPVAQHQTKSLQRTALTAQLTIAKQVHKPVVLHVRDQSIPEDPTPGNAYWDILEILREHNLDQPVILHCVSGPLAYIQATLTFNTFYGVAGNVTYPSADHIRTLVRYIPVDRVLLETDAPFLPPQSHRGQPCQPWMISETAEYLASELDISSDQVLSNTLKLFPQFAQIVA